MEEEWRAVVGYEGLYEVSNLGRVKSLFRYKQIVKGVPTNRGYLRVTLCKNKVHKLCSIHRLVATAFIPNPYNYPCVNHKDEERTNNQADNLEWCSYKYNVNYGNILEKKRHMRLLLKTLISSLIKLKKLSLFQTMFYTLLNLKMLTKY